MSSLYDSKLSIIDSEIRCSDSVGEIVFFYTSEIIRVGSNRIVSASPECFIVIVS